MNTTVKSPNLSQLLDTPYRFKGWLESVLKNDSSGIINKQGSVLNPLDMYLMDAYNLTYDPEWGAEVWINEGKVYLEGESLYRVKPWVTKFLDQVTLHQEVICPRTRRILNRREITANWCLETLDKVITPQTVTTCAR